MPCTLPNDDSVMARPRTRSDPEVLSAALRAVAAHGVAGLTLADVAREAGLAPSTLAERFGSKRALLLAAARHAAGEVRLERTGSPLAAAVDGLVALAAGVADRRAVAPHPAPPGPAAGAAGVPGPAAGALR